MHFFQKVFIVPIERHVCILLVWIIYLLQWFWFYLLLKVIYKSIFLGVSDDNRSDSEEELKQSNPEFGPPHLPPTSELDRKKQD